MPPTPRLGRLKNCRPKRTANLLDGDRFGSPACAKRTESPYLMYGVGPSYRGQSPPSLRLQLGGLDHSLPLDPFGDYVLCEVLGGPGALEGTGIPDLLDCRLGFEALHDLVRKLLHDLEPRARGCRDVPPECGLEVRVALFGNARHIGRGKPSSRRAHAQCPQGA